MHVTPLVDLHAQPAANADRLVRKRVTRVPRQDSCFARFAIAAEAGIAARTTLKARLSRSHPRLAVRLVALRVG